MTEIKRLGQRPQAKPGEPGYCEVFELPDGNFAFIGKLVIRKEDHDALPTGSRVGEGEALVVLKRAVIEAALGPIPQEKDAP